MQELNDLLLVSTMYFVGDWLVPNRRDELAVPSDLRSAEFGLSIGTLSLTILECICWCLFWVLQPCAVACLSFLSNVPELLNV